LLGVVGADRIGDLRGLRFFVGKARLEDLCAVDRFFFLAETEAQHDGIAQCGRRRVAVLLVVFVVLCVALVPVSRLVIHCDRLPVAADLVGRFARGLGRIHSVLWIEQNLPGLDGLGDKTPGLIGARRVVDDFVELFAPRRLVL
jgi:hypothetical protein